MESKQNKIIFTLLIIATFILAIYFRDTLAKFSWFYEPDGFFHYAVIRAAVLHNFSVPYRFVLSGAPGHPIRVEPIGLYWVALVPYFFLRFVGVSYYMVMKYIPILYGLLTLICVYFATKYLSKNRIMGIFAMLFLALSLGNASRTSALVYRGDGFVSVYFLIALIFLMEIFRNTDKQKKIIYAIAAAFFLSLCDLVWNGSPFATAVIIFTITMLLVLSFIFEKKEMLESTAYVIGSLLLWFILLWIYIFLTWTVPRVFNGINFALMVIPLVIGWFALNYLLKNVHRFAFVNTAKGRAALIVATIVVVGVIFQLFFPTLMGELFIHNGIVGSASGFASTIQELRPPTAPFIFASFTFASILTPMTWIIYLSTLFKSQYIIIGFWLLVLAVSSIYLFIDFEDSDGALFSGKAQFKFNLNPSLIILVSYFDVEAYLQMSAVRFNALFAVPMAILAAYTLYWLVVRARDSHKTYVAAAAALLAIIAVVGNYYQMGLTFTATDPVVKGIMFALLFSLTALSIYWLYITRKLTGMHRVISAACFIIVTAMFLAEIYYAYIFTSDMWITYHQFPANNFNPQFIQSLTWLKNNSANTSTVLTLWPDGSVVEAIANRTSVIDSVGSQNGTKVIPYASWILNTTPDPAFLLGNITGKPNYLLVRYYWLSETSALYAEGQSLANASTYGATLFTQYNVIPNATGDKFYFNAPAQNQRMSAYINKAGNSIAATAYIIQNSTNISPVSYIVFSDQSNGNYTIYKQNVFNVSNGETLVVVFSDVPNRSLPVNITFAYLMNGHLAASNLIKLLYLCNSRVCTWNNNQVTMQLAYQNSDDKIFKVIYNNT